VYHDPYFEITKKINKGVVNTKDRKKVLESLKGVVSDEYIAAIDLNYLRSCSEFPLQLKLFGLNAM
jgi:hypothetical protein